MFRNVSLVIYFTTIEWNLETSDSGGVADYRHVFVLKCYVGPILL